MGVGVGNWKIERRRKWKKEDIQKNNYRDGIKIFGKDIEINKRGEMKNEPTKNNWWDGDWERFEENLWGF